MDGLVSATAHLPFGQPFIHSDAGKPGELAREFYVRQATREKVVNRADGHPEAGGELPLVLILPLRRLFRASGAVFCFVAIHHPQI